MEKMRAAHSNTMGWCVHLFRQGKLAQVQMDLFHDCCPRGARMEVANLRAVVFVQETSQPPHSGRSGDSFARSDAFTNTNNSQVCNVPFVRRVDSNRWMKIHLNLGQFSLPE